MSIDPQKILSGNRRALAKAITLIESQKPEHRKEAQKLLETLLPNTGKAKRIGITGSPGVGKSTFIENFGQYLIEQGHKPAVLAVDPSSPLSGGSILADKTRMEKLAQNSSAFIRPSPSSGALGGVALKTRETLLLCEAAGFDVILVETVGVGQSEYEVADMVDFFTFLVLPGGGDDIQGIKKGILELTNAIVINKADGDSKAQAEQTKRHYENALQMFQSSSFLPPIVQTCSALENRGIDNIWKNIDDFFQKAETQGHLQETRKKQNRRWLDKVVWQLVRETIESNKNIKETWNEAKIQVESGKTTPYTAAQNILKMLFS